jgi:FixJ family two-component response regulator
MRNVGGTVLVIDDDAAFRDSIDRLLRSVNLLARMYSSASQFLEADRPDGPSCIVLDIRMPGMSGLEFQRELVAADIQTPIIFMTGYGDITMTVQAMKGGAIEFLTKPFRDQDLIDAINVGLSRDHARHQSQKALEALNARFQLLSRREREIMIHVVRGRLSKQIANDIGISEATVKVHRSNLMRKMSVSGLPELGLVAEKLNLISQKT